MKKGDIAGKYKVVNKITKSNKQRGILKEINEKNISIRTNFCDY